MTTDMAAKPVNYASFGTASNSFQHSRTCFFGHAEVVERMELAIESAGLWVLGKVDAQAFVCKGGFALRGTLQILAFHPRYMVRLVEADPTALLGAPIKFAILEAPEGNVVVSWTDQGAAFARYENPALAALGVELDAMCSSIVADALDQRDAALV